MENGKEKLTLGSMLLELQSARKSTLREGEICSTWNNLANTSIMQKYEKAGISLSQLTDDIETLEDLFKRTEK